MMACDAFQYRLLHYPMQPAQLPGVLLQVPSNCMMHGIVKSFPAAAR